MEKELDPNQTKFGIIINSCEDSKPSEKDTWEIESEMNSRKAEKPSAEVLAAAEMLVGATCYQVNDATFCRLND